MRSALNKRLDAVEENLGEGLFVVIYRGLPPYFVQEHKPGNQGKVTEPFQIATTEELEAYVASLPRSSKVIEVVCEAEGEPTVFSSDIYSWGL